MKNWVCTLEKFQKNKSLDESKRVILDLASSNDRDPILLYECGCCLNMLGFYQEAIFLYEKLRTLQLPKDLIEDFCIRLALAYIVTQNLNKALSTSDIGLQQFPESNALRFLRSIALYSLGKHDNSVKTLSDILLNTSKDETLLSYSREIRSCLDLVFSSVND